MLRMSHVLYLSDVVLADPNKGTPLRICNFFRQIKKSHKLWIVARSVSPEFANSFIPYPKLRGMAKFRFLSSLIKEHKIDFVLTTTETGILAPVILKIFCGVRIAMDLHGVYADELRTAGTITLGRYVWMKLTAWTLLPLYDRVFPCTGKLVEYYRPFSRHWNIVYGGINPEDIPARKMPSRTTNSFVLGYMGNARAYQGLQFIVESAARLKSLGIPVALNLIVTRDNGETESLLAKHSLKESATIYYDVSHSRAEELIRDSDVLAISRPSLQLTEYAFPSKLPEYLASGIPTIVTDVGPINELKKELEGRCMIISSEHITDSLTVAFEKVYCMSVDERVAMGIAAREYALARFSWDTLGTIINVALTV